MASEDSNYLHGIDVSHFQGDVDWPAVASAGISFCFIKATEGLRDVDPMFERNWAGAKAAGLLRGAYHFFHPDEDAKGQAEHFLATVPLDSGALPPALDIEVTNGVGPQALQAGIETWVKIIEAKAGRKPVLYTDPSFWRDNVKAELGAYPLWLACYGDRAELPPGWQSWTFWQHSQAGRVAGIEGAVDLNNCALPKSGLKAMCCA